MVRLLLGESCQRPSRPSQRVMNPGLLCFRNAHTFELAGEVLLGWEADDLRSCPLERKMSADSDCVQTGVARVIGKKKAILVHPTNLFFVSICCRFASAQILLKALRALYKRWREPPTQSCVTRTARFAGPPAFHFELRCGGDLIKWKRQAGAVPSRRGRASASQLKTAGLRTSSHQ